MLLLVCVCENEIYVYIYAYICKYINDLWKGTQELALE